MAEDPRSPVGERREDVKSDGLPSLPIWPSLPTSPTANKTPTNVIPKVMNRVSETTVNFHRRW
ncbi:MAG: hypothetical protein O4859_23705 [Trichodesmium sp. St18_bin1]|nr:hypothetical protein [Trichodesmium sp. MAG_R02]MDE5084067.1 hypothetical protein [Trichodesmium sp. St18_bin1]